ncbi:hypothetical protein HMPREF1986_01394 [Oribacterium sp. oral taxon 078 str. F0263]|nr:hypothetical protein HMPREF1986_01394 [Oribacterium sp. oral taxon 078 str. F0263]
MSWKIPRGCNKTLKNGIFRRAFKSVPLSSRRRTAGRRGSRDSRQNRDRERRVRQCTPSFPMDRHFL